MKFQATRSKAEWEMDSIRLGGGDKIKSHVWLQNLQITVLAREDGKTPLLDKPIGI